MILYLRQVQKKLTHILTGSNFNFLTDSQVVCLYLNVSVRFGWAHVWLSRY